MSVLPTVPSLPAAAAAPAAGRGRARVLRPGKGERDEYWVMLHDPKGNEFCVQRSVTKR